MKRNYKILITILGALSAIGIVLSCKSYYNRNGALLIIDGADGPTSIFLAGKLGNSHILYPITGIFIIALICCCIFLFKKKK